MIKRTVYFGNPAYLSLRDKQLVIRLPEVEKNEMLPVNFKKEAHTTIPIEDIGIVVIDNSNVTITHGLANALIDNNAAVLWCNNQHLPNGLILPMSANSVFTQHLRHQLDASEPLKKQLWRQTVIAKIRNQASVLKQIGKLTENMLYWADSVTSGDSENHEARASAYYWMQLFPPELNFIRGRDELPPNNLLNYGYALLRAVVARSLVASGMLPALGIHHSNKYNAYCLADDIMEPYRPVVDNLVLEICNDYNYNLPNDLSKEIKTRLLQVPTLDVVIEDKRSPLMVGMQRTTASLMSCFKGEAKKILYPVI